MVDAPSDLEFLTADTLELALPAECEPGVAANLRLLADHYEKLRAFDPEMP